jgi:hypothetical protein
MAATRETEHLLAEMCPEKGSFPPEHMKIEVLK